MIKNSFFFIGRVVRDPEQKVFQSGNTLTTVCLAVQSRNKNGDYTDFFDIDMWGKLGETALKHLKKGRLIAVEGEIRTRIIDTQNGKRKVYDFKATDFRFLDAPTNNTNNTKTLSTEEEEDLEEDVLENFEETEIEEKEEQKKVVSMPKKKTSTTQKTKTPTVKEIEEVEDDLPF